jgi:hypothetical protein
MADVKGFCDGAALLLGVLLLTAGALKLWRPMAFAHALYRLLPERLTSRSRVALRAAPAVAGLELATGAALVGAPWWPAGVATGAAAAAALLYAAFVGVVGWAVRKGTACGCFSSFSDGPAGGAELGRSLALAALAATALGLRVAATIPTGWRWVALAWLAGLGAATVLAAAAGGRLRPAPAPRRPATTQPAPRRPATTQPATPVPAAPAAPATPAAAVLRRWGPLMLGRVTSRLETVELPTVRTLRGDARDRAVAAARAAPTWQAFEDWLGDRAQDLDWDAAPVRHSATAGVGGRRRFLRVELAAEDGTRVAISVPASSVGGPATGADATVFALVDRRVVTAVEGRVVAREPPPPQPAPATAAGEAGSSPASPA